MQALARPTGIAVVAVGFSPPPALAGLAAHLGWDGPFLSDPDRRLYAVLGLGRAPLWRVYSPATVLRYARAAVSDGWRPGTGRPARTGAGPTEDVRQLGGDALVVDGIVVRRWLPRTPSDRADPATLVAAATTG